MSALDEFSTEYLKKVLREIKKQRNPGHSFDPSYRIRLFKSSPMAVSSGDSAFDLTPNYVVVTLGEVVMRVIDSTSEYREDEEWMSSLLELVGVGMLVPEEITRQDDSTTGNTRFVLSFIMSERAAMQTEQISALRRFESCLARSIRVRKEEGKVFPVAKPIDFKTFLKSPAFEDPV